MLKNERKKSTPHSLPAIQDFTLASPGLDRHAHEVAITRHEALTQPTTLTSPGGSTPTSKENDHREKLLAARAHLQSTRETTTPPTAVVPPPNKVESTKDSQHAHGQLRSFDIDDVDLDSMIEKIPNAEHVTGKDGTISAIPKEKPPKTTRTRVETSPLLVRVVLPSAQKNHDIFAQAPNWGSAIADTKINTTSPTPHTEPAPTNKGNKGRVESGVSLDVQPPREAIPATKTIIIDQNIGITPDTQKNTAINESGDVNKAIAAPDSTVNNTTKVPATPPHKETLLKRIGKWTAKLAVVALAVFSTHQPKDRHGDAEHAEPEMTQTNTIETPPTTDEMIFDVSEVDSYDTTSTHETTTPPTTDDSMVFEPSEVEYYGTTPNEPPVQATQDLLDNAIDQDTTTSTLTQMIHETLAQTLGTQTAQDVMLRTHNAIERYNESVHSGRWSDALTSRGEIINTIRDIQEQTLSPSTLTPERELLPIEAILDTQYIGHGEGQSGTVWEALAHVGELPLRHADGTPYWSDERAFHSWRNAQLTEMNNPRLVHSGDRIETYIDSTRQPSCTIDSLRWIQSVTRITPK
jgi:hypothetical protein